MGFNGKAAIHPSQIEIIKKSFLPSEDELEEAKILLKHLKSLHQQLLLLEEEWSICQLFYLWKRD